MSLNRFTRRRVHKRFAALERTAARTAQAPFETLEDRRLLAATFVADLTTTAATADPTNLTRVGGNLFFFASDSGGRELWKTDGTEAGTARVKDIEPGPRGSIDAIPTTLRAALAVGRTLFFTAAASDTGSELWKSDGTEAGTVLVKDINPGAAGSSPSGFAELDGTFYFTAAGDFGSRFLWKSDGTEVGTVPIGPAALSSAVPAGGMIYFAAGADRNLWATDGTETGTTSLGGSRPDWLTPVGDTLFFVNTDFAGDTELWKATGRRIERVANLNPSGSSNPTSLTSAGGALYFTAQGRLYKSEGTAATTVEVLPAPPPGQQRSVQRVVGVGDTAYAFVATNNATELWSIDGTGLATRLVTTVPVLPKDAWASDGRLFFTLPRTVSSAALWTSDGTAAATVEVKGDVPVETETFSDPKSLPRRQYAPEAVGGKWYFAGRDAAGVELWMTDGTPTGTSRAADVYPGTGDSYTAAPGAALGDKFFFGSRDPNGAGLETLFMTDAPVGGAAPFLSRDGVPFNGVTDIVAASGAIYFTAGTQTRKGLWKTDGSPEGTVLVSDFGLPNGPAGPNDIWVAGRLLYVRVSSDLWVSDGTAPGTVLLRRFSGLSPVEGVGVGDTVYFRANDGLKGEELWKSDGTTDGTALVKDSVPGTQSSFPDNFLQVGSLVYFSEGPSLWRTDGTADGTFMLARLPSPAWPALGFAPLDGVVYFGAIDAGEASLWRTDGTPAGTTRVAALGTVSGTSFGKFAVAGGRIFFATGAGDAGYVLWRTDGTEAGTRPVATLPRGASPELIGEVGGALMFVGEDPVAGRELWRSDGTPEGTRRAADIFPGPNSSDPSKFTIVGDTLYFRAADPQHGRELWKYTPDPAPPAARVVGRSVFYAGSAFDADGATPGAGDDAAIAADKLAMLPGEASSFANVTSYTRGINGVMIDVAGLPGEVTADDFEFTVASVEGVASRVVAPEPTSVTVRRGAGAGGSDRVTLTWADDAVRNAWLSVTLKANARTGLAANDVFSVGNLIGDTGDGTGTTFRVNALDLGAVKRALNTSSAIDGRYDFNRDGRVNALDLGAVKANLNRSLAMSAAPAMPASVAPLGAGGDVLFVARVWDETGTEILP